MHVLSETSYGKLAALLLEAPDGARAIISLFGAHVLSWRSADGREQLFMSERSSVDGSRAIRGGVPVIFPQFSEQGSGIRHGFARISTWQLAESGMDEGAAFASFTLSPMDLSEAARASWPHAANLRLRVAVRADEIAFRLEVENCGADAFSFAAALHSYLRVPDIRALSIMGLQDVLYAHAGGHDAPVPQQQASLEIDGALDRIYRSVPRALSMRAGDVAHTLSASGFKDTVVWNPGAEGAAALADMADLEYRKFVCIEPALLDGHLLQPGASWIGQHRIRA